MGILFKMENAYGIGITNRYALFLDEDADPLDILKQSEADQKLAKAKKIEEATKPAPKSVKKEAVNNKNDNSDKENQRNNARFEGKRVLDARKAGDGPREERNNMRNQEREDMKESLEMVEPVSKPKTSEAVVERAIGEPLRMTLRKEMKLLTILLWKKPQLMEKLLLRVKLRMMPLLKTRSLSKKR